MCDAIHEIRRKLFNNHIAISAFEVKELMLSHDRNLMKLLELQASVKSYEAANAQLRAELKARKA